MCVCVLVGVNILCQRPNSPAGIKINNFFVYINCKFYFKTLKLRIAFWLLRLGCVIDLDFTIPDSNMS